MTGMFSARLTGLVRQIDPDLDADILASQIVGAFWPEGKHRRKRARILSNRLWSEHDPVLITYGDTIRDGRHKPLDLLEDFLTRHVSGVINGVHILPFFPFSSDDGFAVTDYRAVNPQLGDWPDIERIAARFHLMSDLVLNHVSSQGAWFNAYRQGRRPMTAISSRAIPADDLSEVVRPRTTPLLQEIERPAPGRAMSGAPSVMTVDLDFRNPEVLLEMLRIIRLHVDHGVRTLRLDAVAFIWKEAGTRCIHLAQTHAIVQLLRLSGRLAQETVVLLTETNVPRTENLSYFGNRNEAHAIYNFPLPPLVLHAMQSGTARFLHRWQSAMPPAQMGCAYLNFTASHDGIGMRPAEGVLPQEEKARMIDCAAAGGRLVSMQAMPDGGEEPYRAELFVLRSPEAHVPGRGWASYPAVPVFADHRDVAGRGARLLYPFAAGHAQRSRGGGAARHEPGDQPAPLGLSRAARPAGRSGVGSGPGAARAERKAAHPCPAAGLPPQCHAIHPGDGRAAVRHLAPEPGPDPVDIRHPQCQRRGRSGQPVGHQPDRGRPLGRSAERRGDRCRRAGDSLRALSVPMDFQPGMSGPLGEGGTRARARVRRGRAAPRRLT
ncbi:MAG: alpha-amylase family glycosyl hydrolase [Paracoccaceae bacterium]